jgi:1,4-dihydroxy-2-naphthoate polyprenyltransferase
MRTADTNTQAPEIPDLGPRTSDLGPQTVGRLKSWLLATRPKTLAAGLVPVVVGGALAYATNTEHSWPHWFGCLLGALLIQIAVNFANDAFDGLSGADGADRLGPQRAVASGLISARAMFIATGVILVLALVLGLWLAQRGGWPVLALGVVSLICAIAYTGGPFPLAHKGLGDVFVVLFFGHFAVLGTAWIQVAPMVKKTFGIPIRFDLDMSFHWWLGLPREWWAIATAIGLQAAAIICVNNIRDIPSDTRAGKRTLAVRLGERASRWYYGGLHGAATLLWLIVAITWKGPLAVPAVLAGLGGALLTYGVARTTGIGLNAYLARSAALELATGLAGALVLIFV